MIGKIPDEIKEIKSFEDVVVLEKTGKKSAIRSIINNGGLIMGAFILFVVVVVMTSDISLMTVYDFASLGLQFFVLILCSYAMYVSCSDSGTRAGQNSALYIEGISTYKRLKKSIIERKMQMRIPEFCRYYVMEELFNTRNRILAEVGIAYETYMEKYVGRDKKTIRMQIRKRSDDESGLSRAQAKAIIRANGITPIRLTAEMIFRCGRRSDRRSPLGTDPEIKKRIAYGTKFVSTCVASLLLTVIVFSALTDVTWATFAQVVMKLFTVALNGFYGYKMGFENVVIDTVDYMDGQSALMEQVIQYVEENPVPVDKKKA